ncbi:MAG: hypothetical protein ABS81_01115 [Pseudonocardia sp. SCN 72-86]|nr:MAG: hypothetical protein ABS81_01115 [Pseudonocardia sp. SCN 72-86]
MSSATDAGGARRVVDFDHHSSELPEMCQDLGVGAVLSSYQSECPVGWSERHGGFWFVTGYDELKQIAVDDKRFSSAFVEDPADPDRLGYRGVGVPALNPFPFGFLEMDDPDHGYVRRALNPMLTPAAVERWQPVIDDLTDAFIDRVIEAGECDLIDDIASPIPAVLTLMLLGAPVDRWKDWARAAHMANGTSPGTPEKAAAEADMNAMVAEIGALIADLREHPERSVPGSLLDAMMNQEIGGRKLADQEILLHAVLIIAGGVDTTTSVMGAALKWLDRHPQERARLAADPSLVPGAVEEFLRVFSPATGLARTAKCPVVVGDQTIEEGERVLLLFAAANYDPSAFDDPTSVIIDRKVNRHTTFGLGGHRCIGLHFARATFVTVLREVLARMPDHSIEHAAAKVYPDISVNQGWISLPMRFTPGTRVGSDFSPESAGVGAVETG